MNTRPFRKRLAAALLLPGLCLSLACSSCKPSEKELILVAENLFAEPVAADHAGGGTALRVLTFNTKVCDYGQRIDEAAAEIRAQNAHIVFVQEIDNAVERSGNQNILKKLAALLEMNYVFFPAITLQNGSYGIGILSKLPLENPERIPLESGTEEGRVLAKARVVVNGMAVDLYNTHLSFESEELRVGQLNAVHAKTAESNLFLLAGDFNAKNFEEYTILQNCAAVNAPQSQFITFNRTPEGSFGCIDNILVSRGVQIAGARMAESAVSDHNLLIADLLLAPEGEDVSRETSSEETGGAEPDGTGREGG